MTGELQNFDPEELADASRIFMENMKTAAGELSCRQDAAYLRTKYFKAVVLDDFEDKLVYGMAIGWRYQLPEEYERISHDF